MPPNPPFHSIPGPRQVLSCFNTSILLDEQRVNEHLSSLTFYLVLLSKFQKVQAKETSRNQRTTGRAADMHMLIGGLVRRSTTTSICHTSLRPEFKSTVEKESTPETSLTSTYAHRCRHIQTCRHSHKQKQKPTGEVFLNTAY